MTDQLQKGNKDLKEVATLKQTASITSRLTSNIEELMRDITSLEQDLSRTGSTKTATQLKEELDDLSSKL